MFAGTNCPTFSTNTAWAATLTAAAFPPDPTISGSTWTNVPGRIQFTASGAKSYLDLTWAKMDGQSYLLLSATNHFVGCNECLYHLADQRHLPGQHKRHDGDQQSHPAVLSADAGRDPGLERALDERIGALESARSTP